MSEADDYLTINWCETEKLKWHLFTISINNFDDYIDYVTKYENIVKWIRNNVSGHLKHTRYDINEKEIRVRFRYEKDFILFLLFWS